MGYRNWHIYIWWVRVWPGDVVCCLTPLSETEKKATWRLELQEVKWKRVMIPFEHSKQFSSYISFPLGKKYLVTSSSCPLSKWDIGKERYRPVHLIWQWLLLRAACPYKLGRSQPSIRLMQQKSHQIGMKHQFKYNVTSWGVSICSFVSAVVGWRGADIGCRVLKLLVGWSSSTNAGHEQWSHQWGEVSNWILSLDPWGLGRGWAGHPNGLFQSHRNKT